jgi:TRAP-type C4-dicarboxylate transport system permease small subunit
MALLLRLRQVVDAIVRLSALLGAAGLLVILGAVAGDVVGRSFGRPLYGARDAVSMAGVVVVFGGMAYVHRTSGHISVDLFERSFSPRFNRVLLILANLIGAAVFSLIVWQLWKAVALARMLNMATNLLMIPRAPFLYAMAGFAAVTVLSMVLRAVEVAAGLHRSGDEPGKGAA